MQHETLCMGCMQPLPAGRSECGLCGYPADGENPPEFLPVGTRLTDRYLVGRVLSVNGDAATYIGLDAVEHTPLWVYEFLPLTLCARGKDGAVEPLNGCAEAFSQYFILYRQHIRALARLRELPILAPIFDIFEQNGTIYAVSEPAEGTPLPQYMQQQGGRLTWEDARRLFVPLLSALVTCHSTGMYHFGISPDRLLISPEGQLLLTGFSLPQARTVNTDLKPQLPSGFAAPEQYDFAGTCTPATDVYALAATLFFALSGRALPAGDQRDPQGRDLLLPREVSSHLPSHVAATLNEALKADPARRIQTVQELRDGISSGAVVQSLSADPVPPPAEGAPKKKAKPKKNSMQRYAIWGGIGVVVVLLILAAIVLKNVFFADGGPDTEPTASTTVEMPSLTTESRSTLPSGAVMEAPKLTDGKTDYFSLSVTASGYHYEDFSVTLEGLTYSELPYGTIVSQTPAAGERVAAGTPISVVISAGQRPSVIPSVSGWKAEHAQKYLEALGFKVTWLEDSVEGVERGNVIGTLPEEGRSVDPGKGNAVTLRVSTWVPPTTPPEE